MRWTHILPLAALVVLAVALSAQEDGKAAAGKKLFTQTDDLEFPSCAHCHATVSAEEELAKTGHVRPAYPVWNTAHRGAWKNKPKGKNPGSAGDAGNICVVAFQKRKKLPAGRVAELNAYLASVSPSEEVEPRRIHYAPKLPRSLDGGDKDKGKRKVEAYCGGCHGKSDDHLQFAFKPGKFTRRKIAMKVRGWVKSKKAKSGMRFKANNGMMSFFAKDRLPDADLLDILAYLGKR